MAQVDAESADYEEDCHAPPAERHGWDEQKSGGHIKTSENTAFVPRQMCGFERPEQAVIGQYEKNGETP